MGMSGGKIAEVTFNASDFCPASLAAYSCLRYPAGSSSAGQEPGGAPGKSPAAVPKGWPPRGRSPFTQIGEAPGRIGDVPGPGSGAIMVHPFAYKEMTNV
jgi:hypothetical protein